jgi:hypothetical protein
MHVLQVCFFRWWGRCVHTLLVGFLRVMGKLGARVVGQPFREVKYMLCRSDGDGLENAWVRQWAMVARHGIVDLYSRLFVHGTAPAAQLYSA